MFSIITPTYQRKEKLLRAVTSLQSQSYQEWEMIVVNDSPDDTSYHGIQHEISDARVKYVINEENKGVNYSRNRALDTVDQSSEWIIFLDDDDYFAPDTLSTFVSLIQTHPEVKWFVTDRKEEPGNILTRFPKSDMFYSYAFDYLISKKCKGDATHCIKKELIRKSRFSQKIKQGEEWFFFYQLGKRSPMFYHSHASTLTDGYTEGGLNFRKRNTKEQLETVTTLLKEAMYLHFTDSLFYLYITLRCVRSIIK